MCFSPQRRAIFQHLNFKKCSEPLSFLAFSLENVLLATAACNFWFLLWPHDSAPAALTSLLFHSPDTRIIGKTQRFATPLTFGADVSSFFWLSRYCIFFLLTLLHLLTLLSSDFTSSHLLFICFSTLHIVGSLLFKLPSIIYIYIINMPCVYYVYFSCSILIVCLKNRCCHLERNQDVARCMHRCLELDPMRPDAWRLGQEVSKIRTHLVPETSIIIHL